MPDYGIPDRVRQFIFENVDSVELIEVLLFLRRNRSKTWSAQDLIGEFRSSAQSIMSRLSVLKATGLVSERPASPGAEGDSLQYVYDPSSPELDELIADLEQAYQLRKHKVMELIFSPTKRARPFADAFMVTKPIKRTGEENG